MWSQLNFLVGTWYGVGSGRPGTSQVERSYQFIFNGKFLELRTKATYPPQAQNPQGEIHEDVALISYDTLRGRFVSRQFHVEGFVNHFVLEHIDPDGKTFVFVTESIENIPAGWRARETYQVLSPDEFIESFELAAPGQDFKFYSQNHLKRAKESA